MGAGDAFFSLASIYFLDLNHWRWLVLWEMHMPVCRWRPLDIETSSAHFNVKFVKSLMS